MTAFVYLIEETPLTGDASGPWTKIGYSKNLPEWRLHANLKRGNPRNLRVAAAFVFKASEEARGAERAAHRQFAPQGHQKDWFRVPWQAVAEWLESTGAKLR